LCPVCVQVGVTPEGVEVPRCVADPEGCQAAVEAFPPEHRPALPTGPGMADAGGGAGYAYCKGAGVKQK
jgi:hypothetical protein